MLHIYLTDIHWGNDLKSCLGALEDLNSGGAAIPELQKLSSIGTDGEWAGNTRRDLLTMLFPQIDLPSPLTIRVPYLPKDASLSRIEYTDAAIFMPNEVFHCLYLHYPGFSCLSWVEAYASFGSRPKGMILSRIIILFFEWRSTKPKLYQS